MSANFVKEEYAREPLRLASMCLANNIPFEIGELYGGLIVCYPTATEDRVSDAVCHDGSYGRHEGLLEMMGLVDEEAVGDSVEGFLTAEQVFERWHKHWLETHGVEGE